MRVWSVDSGVGMGVGMGKVVGCGVGHGCWVMALGIVIRFCHFVLILGVGIRGWCLV